MRRFTKLFALVSVLALVAAACGGGGGGETTTTAGEAPAPETTAAAPETTTTTAAPETAPPEEAVKVGMVFDIGGRGDQSFNDAAAAGLDRAVADFGVEPIELEPSAGGENREELLRLLSEQGVPLIFAVGFLFTDSVAAAAADFPDTKYGLIDSVVDSPNVASLVFAEEQGSFLVGAAAALKSQTGKVGFIGGVEIDLIKKFQAGFEAGVKAVNPDAEIIVQYVSQPPDFSGFNDPARGREIGTAMYEQGADVVYHAAGGTGGGLFEAAKEYSEANNTKVWAIGVDSDQYNQVDDALKPYILTSMLKRVDVAVYNTIEAFVNGEFSGGVVVFDLSVDGVGFSTSGGFVDDIADQLNDFKAKIISGEIVVPTAPEA